MEGSLGEIIRITEDRVDPLVEIMRDKEVMLGNHGKTISGEIMGCRVAPLRVLMVKRVVHSGKRVTMMAHLLVILQLLSIK